jgi:hypothetical protein
MVSHSQLDNSSNPEELYDEPERAFLDNKSERGEKLYGNLVFEEFIMTGFRVKHGMTTFLRRTLLVQVLLGVSAAAFQGGG